MSRTYYLNDDGTIGTLKPCPFCGGNPEFMSDTFLDGEIVVSIGCQICGAQIRSEHVTSAEMRDIPLYKLEEAKRIEADRWNRRTNEEDCDE